MGSLPCRSSQNSNLSCAGTACSTSCRHAVSQAPMSITHERTNRTHDRLDTRSFHKRYAYSPLSPSRTNSHHPLHPHAGKAPLPFIVTNGTEFRIRVRMEADILEQSSTEGGGQGNTCEGEGDIDIRSGEEILRPPSRTEHCKYITSPTPRPQPLNPKYYTKPYRSCLSEDARCSC